MAINPSDTAAQLRCPHGSAAKKVAEKMNRSNEKTNLRAINVLQIAHGDRILEIGPGNGKFVSTVLDQAANVSYVGLDWSSEMVAAASALNSKFVAAGRAMFQQGSSSHIPFGDSTFNRILTVHTIYFWEEPQLHLMELRRVLAPDGKLCICFGDKAFMEGLPFTNHGFRLYDTESASHELNEAGFSICQSLQHIERGESNAGMIVDKQINILVCTAQNSKVQVG
ncbi:MAG: class I SAM-dependent methyltransferase [Cyanobacteria bacterium P01_F01_bin.86]